MVLLTLAVTAAAAAPPDPFTGPMAAFLTREAHPIEKPDRDVDIEHMVLRLRVDLQKRTLAGEVRYRVRPFASGTDRWVLDAGSDLSIDGVTVGGEPAAAEHYGDILTIRISRPLPLDRSTEVLIRYHGSPRKGLYFYGRPRVQAWSQGEAVDNHAWFPTHDAPDDRFTSETYWTVRKPYTAISNGRLVEVTEGPEPGWRTFHWSMAQPHVSYLVSVVIGKYRRWTDRTEGGIPVEYYVPPSYPEAVVKRAFGKTPAMIETFGRLVGYPYPYAKYAQTVVDRFLYGGMENITAATLTVRTLRDATAALEEDSDGLVAHELAHQWFGDLITCENWPHAWLNEGFATYFTALWFERDRGRDAFDWARGRMQRTYFNEARRYRRPLAWNLATHPMDFFDRHTYPKGAMILHQLRTLLGEELFWRGLRHYVQKRAFQTVDAEDFQDDMEEATGRNLEWYFDAWVRHAGHPKLRIESSWDPRTHELVVEVRQVQETGPWVPLFRIPTRLWIRAGDREISRPVVIEHERETFRVRLEAPPDLVLLDPGRQWLMEQEWNKTRRELAYQLQHAEGVLDRAWAAGQLGRAGGPEALRALKEAFARESFYGVRIAIAQGLGKVGDDAAREVLLGFLGDPDARVRKAVVEALAKTPKNSRAVRLLEAFYRKERAYGPRAAVIRTLAHWLHDQAEPWIERGLKTPSYLDTIPAAAVRAMEDLTPTDERVRRLKALAGTGRSRDVRTAALAVLGKIRREDRTLTEFIEKQLTDPLYPIRAAALEALVERGDPRSLPALKTARAREIDDRMDTRLLRAIEKLEKKRRKGNRSADARELERRVRRLEERVQALEKKPAAV